jgi:Homeodomain-like domain
MPGRSPHEVVLSEDERAELVHRAACYTRPHREVQRARLVLLAAEGRTNTEIGERLGMSREAVGRWRRRFCERRLDGLEDLERTGRPRRFPPGAGRRGEGDRVRASAGARRFAVALLAG